MILSIIVAMDKNHLIGKGNQLPWHLSADLKHFKTITLGKPIIMGRKTFDSIGKPLIGRRNIVISQQKNLELVGCEVFNSLSAALHAVSDVEEVMIVGGAKIFKLVLPIAHRMYVTFIDHEFEGDTYFPRWNESDWQVVSEEKHDSDEKKRFSFRFVQFERFQDYAYK